MKENNPHLVINSQFGHFKHPNIAKASPILHLVLNIAGIYQLGMMSLSAMSREIITNLHVHLDDTLYRVSGKKNHNFFLIF